MSILFFFVKQTIKADHQIDDLKGPGNTTIGITGGYARIWDGFMWLTLGYGHPCIGSRKITLNSTNPIVLETWDGYDWNYIVIQSY